MTDISNTDDVIDSRDVIKRIEELESERDELAVVIAEAMTEYEGIETSDIPEKYRDASVREDARDAVKEANEALADWDNGTEGEELAALKALTEEASGYAADWHHGETLIRDSYFKDYAMQLADDIGAIPSDLSWPCTCINWDQAASELQIDYTSVDFDGVTYWIRS